MEFCLPAMQQTVVMDCVMPPDTSDYGYHHPCGIGFAIGKRDETTCECWWKSIPATYRRCRPYSDLLKAYQAILTTHTPHPVGKESGQTAHQERWYNTLRQRLGRFTRRALSFSKTDKYHVLVTRWYIIENNLEIKVSLAS
jgi:insertion element IS1 protein InsB